MSLVKIGVVQASSILFDLNASLAKTKQLILEHSNERYDLMLFPEAFIPGYPRGLSFGTVIGKRSEEGKKLFVMYADNSIEVPGKHTESLGKMARDAGIYLAVGVSERDTVSGTLYCTLLYFAPDGNLLGKHRKIKPTGSERIIWGEGDGTTLTTIDSRIGKLGGLICWENYMPMARMAMYVKGVQIYMAPTADNRDAWLTTLKHIALEGRCFVLGCNQFITKDDYPENLQKEITESEEVMSRGGSVIINPRGEFIAGPLFGREGIITAEIDLNEVTKGKMDFDVIGHYARNDIFSFSAINQPSIQKG